MKRNDARVPASRGQKIALGLSACSGSLMVGLTAARDLGGPIIVAIVLAAASLAAALTLSMRAR